MSVKIYKAVVKYKEGLRVEAEARGFKVVIDEPILQGGTNQGMTPVELLLCSLGSCQTMATALFAEERGIVLDELWLELEGDLDSDGFAGVKNVRPGYQRIRFNFHIKSDAPEESILELMETVETFCSVADSINHGVEFEETKITIIK